jgi:ferritin-like metal-binding protein YciE
MSYKTKVDYMDKIHSSIVSLTDLLALEANRIMQGEKELIGALPTWIQRVTSPKLRGILTQYQNYIEHHAEEMTNYFIQQPETSMWKNRVMRALIDDTNDKLKRCADSEIYDACLLAAVQEINHYKISIYGTVTAFFNELGQRETASIFLRAEKDEKRIDEQLSYQAHFNINELAKAPVIK